MTTQTATAGHVLPLDLYRVYEATDPFHPAPFHLAHESCSLRNPRAFPGARKAIADARREGRCHAPSPRSRGDVFVVCHLLFLVCCA